MFLKKFTFLKRRSLVGYPGVIIDELMGIAITNKSSLKSKGINVIKKALIKVTNAVE